MGNFQGRNERGGSGFGGSRNGGRSEGRDGVLERIEAEVMLLADQLRLTKQPAVNAELLVKCLFDQ